MELVQSAYGFARERLQAWCHGGGHGWGRHENIAVAALHCRYRTKVSQANTSYGDATEPHQYQTGNADPLGPQFGWQEAQDRVGFIKGDCGNAAPLAFLAIAVAVVG